MQVGLNYPVVTVFIFYIITVLIVGLIATRVVKNIADYILAGRNLSGPLAALGAGASDMSQWLLMSLPGAVFLNGVNQIWIVIGLSIGAYLNWQLVAKRLRVYTEIANDSLTLPAYFDNRFKDHSKVLRLVTALVVLIFFTFYSSAGFVAGALVTQHIFHLDYHTALFMSASVIIIYTCIGGFIAISWIDFFQGTLMFFAILLVPCVVMYHLDGVQQTIQQLTIQGSHYFDAFYNVGWLGIISLLAWGLGYVGQPHIIVRFMAIRSTQEIPLAKFICMTWMILALYGALFTGLSGAAYYQHYHAQLQNPETIFLVLANILFNPWIAGFLIAAVLSAIMSTASAQLLLAASALTEDFYRDCLRNGARDRELMIVARICVLIIALIAVCLAASSYAENTIMSIVAYAWSGLGASFGPVVLVSLYWRRMTRNAAIAGILTGALTVILWEFAGKHIGGIFTVYSLLPGFIMNLIIIYLVSHLDKEPDKQITKQFDLTVKNLI